ncbi:unnamed protein product [Haemonchus placei]|uniref:Uncharacterized protein n=1 Tax=Haemonchus placei TaxID=6290 RepID=A0A3P8A140_HAEPC|nr:unnamed protein product [Haemonchus placei]
MKTCALQNAQMPSKRLMSDEEVWLRGAGGDMVITTTIGRRITSHSTPLLLLSDVLHEDRKTFAVMISKTGVARYMTDLLASIELDWVALSRREPDDEQSHVLYSSLMIALSRLALTECGWNTLAELALPEVLAELRVFSNPPKQMFLEPASVKKKGSPAELYVSSFEAVIQLCSAICAKPKWKRLSFKILDVVHSQRELLSQLMRAEISCRMMNATALLVQYIWDNGRNRICSP